MGGLAVLLHTAVASSQSPRPAAFLALSSSIVRVEVDRPGGGLSLGSGVTVAPSVVVTNCHVTRDGTFARIAGAGRLWDVTAQYADVLHDLCFLRVPAWRGKPIVLGTSDGLRSGQPVAALGFTGGLGISLRFGHVLALHSLGTGHVIETDTAFTSGASGGGLFDDAGALVGLLTFRLAGSGGNYYSLPAEWIGGHLPTEDQWADLAAAPRATPVLAKRRRVPSVFPARRRARCRRTMGRGARSRRLLVDGISTRRGTAPRSRQDTAKTESSRRGRRRVQRCASTDTRRTVGMVRPGVCVCGPGRRGRVAGRPGEARGAGRGPGRRRQSPAWTIARHRVIRVLVRGRQRPPLPAAIDGSES